MGNSIKIHLELVQLPEDRRVAGNFLVCALNDIPSPVVLNLGKYLGLFAEVLNVLLDIGHEAVEVASKLGQ